MLLSPTSTLEYPELGSIYRRYVVLSARFSSPRGLLLYTGLDRDGVALTIAAHVAGAAALCIEPEPLLAKRALRGGVCDLLVSDLEEALHALRNPLRRGQGISVVLVGEVDLMLAEIVARGVLPEVLEVRIAEDEAADLRAQIERHVQALLSRGARQLDFDDPANEDSDGLIPVSWGVAREPQSWLPRADALASAVLDEREPSTELRRQWIEAAPRYLGKALASQRYLRMTVVEADEFFMAVQREVEAGEIQVAVSVVRDGEEELVLS
jgi:urocanate hydratase